MDCLNSSWLATSRYVCYSKNHHISRQLCRFPQDLRQQHPPLRIHLRHLPVIVHPVQKLLLGRVQAGYLRPAFPRSFPTPARVNLGRPSILTSDVKLRSVTLVHQALELRRQLEPAFFIDASWVIATKHQLHSLLWLEPTQNRFFASTFDHFCPHLSPAEEAVKGEIPANP